MLTPNSFTAALLGSQRLLKSANIQVDFLTDNEDETATEGEIGTAQGGPITRNATALIMFRGSCILAKVLDQLYDPQHVPAASLPREQALSDELETWLNSFPSQLRLRFSRDKPSTNIIGDRSPILVSAGDATMS